MDVAARALAPPHSANSASSAATAGERLFNPEAAPAHHPHPVVGCFLSRNDFSTCLPLTQ